MSDIDWLALDARLLQGLVAVVDAGSITGAAQSLGVTQSAVSHQLDRLRAITGDALFVKSGRGVVATARAGELAKMARELLRQLQAFVHTGGFDPARWQTTLTIAANDFQRDGLLPGLLRVLRQQAPGVQLHVIPSGVPSLAMLRDGVCDLAISPRPPEGSDILQKRLFEDHYAVFYDAAVRDAPATRAAYEAAEHATVVYEARRTLDVDRHLTALGVRRRFVVTVPGFAGLPAFLRGSPLLATAPAGLHRGCLRGFGRAELPVPCPGLPMFLIWHRRHHDDPAHRWLREQLASLAPAAVADGAD